MSDLLVTLIGHPFAPIGRGEHIRAIWRALHSAGINARIFDLHRWTQPDPAYQQLREYLVSSIPHGIRIFHLNGDELAGAIAKLERQQPGIFSVGYNIAFPAWELPRYPQEWAQQLEKFNEVWAASAFVYAALQAALTIPVTHLTNACEPHLSTPLGREHFGLPENRYLILFYFDLLSYASRKNPMAGVEAFRRLRATRPHAETNLVLKLNHTTHNPTILPALRDSLMDLTDRVTLLDATLTDNEMKNLVQRCDCFLSLHRSEGFGRGPAEAMFFGKPVVATGWSGNMEYMNREVSFPVDYELIPVKEGQYPHWQNQYWAEPDISHALKALERLIDEPALGAALGKRAQVHMRHHFSDHVLGLRYRERLRAISNVCHLNLNAVPE